METKLNSKQVVKLIILKKPDRILLSDGIGYHPDRVPDQMSNMTIIFVRADNWSLGCTKETEKEAYLMWSDTWVGFIENNTYKPISEYAKVW